MAEQRADVYGPDLFTICREDLDRLGRWIERTGVGQSLTTLARRFARGRLRYGPVPDIVPLPASRAPELVRLWDPAKAWHQGDGAIFVAPATHTTASGRAPTYGEVIRVQGMGVTVRIDGRTSPQVLGTVRTRGTEQDVIAWRDSVEALVTVARDRGRLPDDPDEGSRIDYALWLHGEWVFGALLSALRHDSRFIGLDGRWFLRSLARPPSHAQLEALARKMLLETTRPLTLEELAPLISPPAQGDAGLYGLARALAERPDLFTNVDRAPRSRWVLGHPPKGVYTAKLAAYDPDTCTVLCEPGETLSGEAIDRLWALDLLRLVVSR